MSQGHGVNQRYLLRFLDGADLALKGDWQYSRWSFEPAFGFPVIWIAAGLATGRQAFAWGRNVADPTTTYAELEARVSAVTASMRESFRRAAHRLEDEDLVACFQSRDPGAQGRLHVALPPRGSSPS